MASDDLTLAAIQQRADYATEDPDGWAIWRDVTDDGFIHVGTANGVIPDGQSYVPEDTEVNPIAKIYTNADAEFIAHARDDVPYLLDQLKAAADALAAEKARADEVEEAREEADTALEWVTVHGYKHMERADKAEQQVKAVQALHWDNDGICGNRNCLVLTDEPYDEPAEAPWPCATIRALAPAPGKDQQ